MSVKRTGLALSVQQPWAWLIVNGFKPVENRDWSTRIRGRIYIHAGKKFDEAGYLYVRQEYPEIEMPAREVFARGGIVGTATLTGCVEDSASPWFFGPYGFALADAVPTTLIPCRGMLGFFRLTPQLLGTADNGRAP